MEAADVERARGGVWLSEGRTGRFQVMIKKKSPDRTYLLVRIKEGKNREVRRLFARLGFPVMELKRLRIGGLTLHGLKPGKCRFLTPVEVRQLMTGVHEEVPE
jgi:pseudouridine synthase